VFDFIRYVIRNPAEITRGARRLAVVRHSMRLFRSLPENQECAWCGRARKLDIHHVVPVSVDPDLAADPDNMIMLCRKPPCHQTIGHHGDFGGRYVENVRDLCDRAGPRVVRIVK